jgi:hypothetical protein
MIKALLTAAFIGTQVMASAFSLRVTGVVTDYLTGSSMEHVLVRVYRDGVKVSAEETGLLGRYAVKLENNAEYVIRFSGPGLVTKCFTIDTHGLVWEGAEKVKDLEVEMTMFERTTSLDLSFFDMPMGRATFEPATGLVSWDTDYDSKIRPQVEALMGQYQRMMTAQASAGRVNATTSADRR